MCVCVCVCVCLLQWPPAAPTKTPGCTMTPPPTVAFRPRAHGCSREPGLPPPPPPVLFLPWQIACVLRRLHAPPLSPLRRLTAGAPRTPPNPPDPATERTRTGDASRGTAGGERASPLRPSLSSPSFRPFLPPPAATSASSVWAAAKGTRASRAWPSTSGSSASGAARSTSAVSTARRSTSAREPSRCTSGHTLCRVCVSSAARRSPDPGCFKDTYGHTQVGENAHAHTHTHTHSRTHSQLGGEMRTCSKRTQGAALHGEKYRPRMRL